MKKKLLKTLVVIMSAVIFCVSASVGSFAVSAEKFDVPELENYFANNILVNESKSIAFFELEEVNDYSLAYAYTKNGTDYELVDFEAYAPECDYCELAASTVYGNTFAFLFYCYEVETLYDDYYEEYYEDYTVIDSYILTTKDFETIDKHYVAVDTDDDIFAGDYYSFAYYGVFGGVGDTFVYANGDYVVTDTVGGYTQIGRGVYYTTEDFENWEMHYTQEAVVWDDYEYFFMYLPSGDGLTVVSEYNWDETYLLLDGEIYGPVSPGYSETEYYDSYYYYTKKNPDTVIRVESVYTDEYYENEDALATFRAVAKDLETGKETVICEMEENFYWYILDNNGILYIQTYSYDDESYTVYEIGSDLKIAHVDTKLASGTQAYSYVLGEELYMIDIDEICIFGDDLTDCLTVDVSGLGLEDTYYVFAYELGGKLYLLETFDYGGKATVYATDADMTQRGDVTGDGKIDSSDALKVLQKATGLIEISETAEYEADANKDGKVTSADALKILQYATGLISRI